MSKRPHIGSAQEKKVERRIQQTRKDRNRVLKSDSRMSKSASDSERDPAKTPEPTIWSHGHGPVEGVSPAVRKWIEAESRTQLKHYRRICREQLALTEKRDQWVKEFFQRITGSRGFSVHAGTRRTIAKQEIPKRTRRPWRVVW
jgi:hypothetical protein